MLETGCGLAMARAAAASRSLLEASLMGLVMLVSGLAMVVFGLAVFEVTVFGLAVFGLAVFGIALFVATFAMLELLVVRPAWFETRNGWASVVVGTRETAFLTA